MHKGVQGRGAQAIAALTYGTSTIPPVDKIVGPGNIYVTRAKRYAHGIVDTDMQTGPSEICIVADATASAPLVAPLISLSQAEHDELAAAVLITTSESLAQAVQRELQVQLETLPRATIAKQSLARFGNIFLVETIAAALDLSQCCGPGTPRTLG